MPDQEILHTYLDKMFDAVHAAYRTHVDNGNADYQFFGVIHRLREYFHDDVPFEHIRIFGPTRFDGTEEPDITIAPVEEISDTEVVDESDDTGMIKASDPQPEIIVVPEQKKTRGKSQQEQG